jgi:hypothetical protein
MHTTAVWRNAVIQPHSGFAHGYILNPTMLQYYKWYMDIWNPINTIITTSATLAVAYITLVMV